MKTNKKWLLLDVLTGILLLIMLGVVAGEILSVSRIDTDPGEQVRISMTGLYREGAVEIDGSFVGERLSMGKQWADASIETVEDGEAGILLHVVGTAEMKAGEICLLDQPVKVGKAFMLETNRLKIPVIIVRLEASGD